MQCAFCLLFVMLVAVLGKCEDILGQGIDAVRLMEEMTSTTAGLSPLDLAVTLKKGPMLKGIHGYRPRYEAKMLVSLCEDVSELWKSLPGQVKVEGFNYPEGALTSSSVGVSDIYLKGGYSFILVTLTKITGSFRLKSVHKGMSLSSVPDSLPEVFTFIDLKGTHFISSYTKGDSLYQVFVYEESKYKALHGKLKLGLTKGELIRLLSPVYSTAVGTVKSLSGHPDSRLLRKALMTNRLFHSYPSLIEMNRKEGLTSEVLDAMSDDSLLHLTLTGADELFPHPANQLMSEAIQNRISLFELNL